MTDWNHPGEERTGYLGAACQVCEAMLPDAVDGLLTEDQQRAFDRHVAGCTACARELEEAQRGAAWLGLLKRSAAPEPNPALLERILQQTVGRSANLGDARVSQAAEKRAALFSPPHLSQAWSAVPVSVAPLLIAQVPRWRRLTDAFLHKPVRAFSQPLRPVLQPRLAMTAAMAFFSIALTLNLTGVRLSGLTLRPAALRRTLADRSAAAVRSFQNMRVVYQAEAQVNDLRTSWQTGEARTRDRGNEPDAHPSQRAPSRNEPQGSSRLHFTPIDPRSAGLSNQGA